jgi:hypothetical protein
MIDMATKAVAAAQRDMEKALKDGGESMVKSAKTSHRFLNRTGKAEDSIKSEVERGDDTLSMTFYIDPEKVTTDTGWNYAWIQNDGSRGRYRRGRISPTAMSVGGGGGVRHDDYMGKAWDNHAKKIMDKIENIFRRLG